MVQARIEGRRDRQSESGGIRARVTGTASEIKENSGSNRPRDHVAEGTHPGALPIFLKVTPSATQAVLFHQNLRQPRSRVRMCSPFAVLPGSGSCIHQSMKEAEE